MNKVEYDKFASGATKVVTIPTHHVAKRIASVRCVNPKEKIAYHYERLHKLKFDDGTTFVQHEDHWCRPGRELKKGNFAVATGPEMAFSFYTPGQFAAQFTPCT